MSEHSRDAVVNHDFPDVKCSNCDNSTFDVSNWMADPEDSERILCRTCGTHILTQIANEEASKAEELQDMAWKIDNEGLDYFLENYISMVPAIPVADANGKTLLELAYAARDAQEIFEHYAKTTCKEHGVEYGS